MNIAQDLVINDILISSKIGSMPKGGMHDPSIVTAADSFLDAYRKIYKSGGGNGGSGGGGFDDHLDPGESQGKTPDKAMSERDERKIKAEIAAANNAAKQMGKMPAALGRVFEEIVTPKVSWREHIQALLARSLGNGSYDWRRPNRRMMMYDHFSPSPSAHGSECVVVACDTSGSIQTSEINMFLSEVGSILEEVRPRSLYIVWCDAAIGRIDECDDPTDLYAVKRAGCPGGGGTDFKPVFEWVSDQGLQPDAVVYLTDGFGSFPSHEPNYPVIWGSTYKDSTYPFGEVVMLPSGSN
jgi:predicted metal-dependent peptidase